MGLGTRDPLVGHTIKHNSGTILDYVSIHETQRAGSCLFQAVVVSDCFQYRNGQKYKTWNRERRRETQSWNWNKLNKAALRLRQETMAFAQLFLENNKVEAFQGKNPKETEETKKQVFEEIKRFRNSSSTWRTNSAAGSVAQEFENMIPDLITMTTNRPLLIILGDGSVVRTAGLAGKAPQTRPILIFLENDHYKAVGREQGISLSKPLLASMIDQNTLFLTPGKANELFLAFNVLSSETSSNASSTSSCDEDSQSEPSISSDDELDSVTDLEPPLETASSMTVKEAASSMTAIEPASSVATSEGLEPAFNSSMIGSEPETSVISSEPASSMITSEPASSLIGSELSSSQFSTVSVEKTRSETAQEFDLQVDSSSTPTSVIASKSTSQFSTKSDLDTTQTSRSNSKPKSRSNIGKKLKKGFFNVFYLVSVIID